MLRKINADRNHELKCPKTKGFLKAIPHTVGSLAVAFCTCGRRFTIALAPFSRSLNQFLPQSFGREFDGVKRRRSRWNEMREAAQPERRRQTYDGSTPHLRPLQMQARDERADLRSGTGVVERGDGGRAARAAKQTARWSRAGFSLVSFVRIPYSALRGPVEASNQADET